MGPPVPSLEYMSRLKGSGGSSPLQYINSYQLLGGRPLQWCRHPYLAHASVTPVKLIGSPSWMELILCSVMSHLSEVGRHLFSSPQKRSLKSPARKPYFPSTGGATFLGQPFSKEQRSSLALCRTVCPAVLPASQADALQADVSSPAPFTLPDLSPPPVTSSLARRSGRGQQGSPDCPLVTNEMLYNLET